MALASSSAPKSCCLLVPLHRPYLTEDEALSLVVTHARSSAKVDLKILHPPDISGFVLWLHQWFARQYSGNRVFGSIQFSKEYFRSVASYSRLLLSRCFYEALSKYELLLIVQADALLLSDELDPWLSTDYSYIGAPWFVGLDHPIKPLRSLGGGNGGLSLRRVADCLKILQYSGPLYGPIRSMEHQTLPHQPLRAEVRALRKLFTTAKSLDDLPIYEDLFWSFIAPKIDSSFQVAPFSNAWKFSIESEPRFFFDQLKDDSLPLGCHAYRKHDPEFWQDLWKSRPEIIQPFAQLARELSADSQSFLEAAVDPDQAC
jgi:hypothetical protein